MRFGVKEATANHAMTKVAAELIRKRRIRVLKEVGVYDADSSGYFRYECLVQMPAVPVTCVTDVADRLVQVGGIDFASTGDRPCSALSFLRWLLPEF